MWILSASSKPSSSTCITDLFTRPKQRAPKIYISFFRLTPPFGEGIQAAAMAQLQVRPAEFSTVKTKAIEDARQMQATVLELCKKAGKDPPKYALLELTGKGSFGRVYKG